MFGGAAILPAGEFGENRSTQLKLELPMQRLPPGESLLTVDATLATNAARRDVRFTVR